MTTTSSLNLLLQNKLSSYSLKSPVIVYLIFRNETTEELIINLRLTVGLILGNKKSDLEFIAFNGEGQRILPKIRTRLFKGPIDSLESDYAILKPGKDYTKKYDLSGHLHLKEADSYLVSALYRNSQVGAEYGLQAWTGELKSNPLKIQLF
jgi:hypothetical protein